MIEIRDEKNNSIRSSKLNLVDLAGSERTYKTDPDCQVKNEAKFINKSLSYLEQVIVALSERGRGQRAHIPYRNSMMTSILRDSLGGNCKTVMIATLSIDKSNEDETLSTARFAHRCQKLVNELHINEQLDLNTVVKRLQEQNIELSKRLKQQESDFTHQWLRAVNSHLRSESGGEFQCLCGVRMHIQDSLMKSKASFSQMSQKMSYSHPSQSNLSPFTLERLSTSNPDHTATTIISGTTTTATAPAINQAAIDHGHQGVPYLNSEPQAANYRKQTLSG